MTVASTTVRGVLRALEAAGVKRFAAVTAAPVGPVPEGESWLNRRVLYPIVGCAAARHLRRPRVMEREIMDSGTDWTIVRPPRLTDRPLTRSYRTAIGANVPRAVKIPRADVAHALLAALDDPATIRQAVGVAA